MQKVQKMKFVYCPSCGSGQYVIPKLGEECGDVVCESCGETFNSTEGVAHEPRI